MADLISGLLDLMRVEGTAYIAKNLTAPWGVHVDRHEHLARFHIVMAGSTWIGMPGSSEVYKLNPGDIAIIPQGKAHDYFDEQTNRERESKAYPTAQSTPRFELFDKDSEDTHLLCGYFKIAKHTPQSLTSCLPDIIIGQKQSADLSSKFAMIVDLAMAEISDPESLSQASLNRLTELLCVYTIHAWFQKNLADHPQLQALTNPKTKLVLDAIHTKPSQPWTVDKLAKLHGKSRTAFAAHFKAAIGISPMSYVRQWRIKQACQMLQEGSHSLDEVAFMSGYSDTNAFNRAFKREIGSSPGVLSRKKVGARQEFSGAKEYITQTGL